MAYNIAEMLAIVAADVIEPALSVVLENAEFAQIVGVGAGHQPGD
jgi:hypothetical protein